MKRHVKVLIQTVCARAAMMALVACVASCATPRNPWMYTAPPTTVEPRSYAVHTDENRDVIVLGSFADPTKAPNYSAGVGKCMSDAFSRALMHEGGFEVWINPQLSDAVQSVIQLPTLQHDAAFAAISRENPRVRYVITGKVTDFYHTDDMPSEASRWGVFGRRHEAIVAIDMRIVDLKTRRVVGADHLKGTAGTGSTPPNELYTDIALDSYVFWTTPLGRASKHVIQSAVSRTAAVVPGARMGDARVEALTSRRMLTINGGSDAGLVAGREYYLITHRTGSEGKAVIDPVTALPVMVRIDSVSRQHATGILRGQPPIELDIRGATLRTSMPAVTATPAAAGGQAADRPAEQPAANEPAAITRAKP